MTTRNTTSSELSAARGNDSKINRKKERKKKLTTRPSSSPVYTECAVGSIQVIAGMFCCLGPCCVLEYGDDEGDSENLAFPVFGVEVVAMSGNGDDDDILDLDGRATGFKHLTNSRCHWPDAAPQVIFQICVSG